MMRPGTALARVLLEVCLVARCVSAACPADFLNALSLDESGGNYRAISKRGYVGKYQFGEQALVQLGYYVSDGKKQNDWSGEWTGKRGVHSLHDFLACAQLQDLVMLELLASNWALVRALGLDKYIGSTIAGITVSQAGILAGAHLVGLGGVKRFLTKRSNVVDANGVTINRYMKKYGHYNIGCALNS